MEKSRHTSSSKAKNKSNRGLGLSIWLILIVVLSFVTGAATLSLIRQPTSPTREWLVSIFLILTAAKAIAALAIWNWKTWGLYLYVIAVLGTMGISLVLTSYLIWGIFYEAIPLLITGWFLRGKLGYFE